MNQEEFYQWTSNMMGAFRTDVAKRMEIRDIYLLALQEIKDGGSESHEISLAVKSIEELIDSSKK